MLSEQIEKIAIEIQKNSMDLEDEIIGFIESSLAWGGKKTTYKDMWSQIKRVFRSVKERDFKKIWQSLIKDKNLVPKGNEYIWKHAKADKETIERTKKELESGLKKFVKDYIEARKANPQLAKKIKKNIDKIIKQKKLDSKTVYFYYGDPDNPKFRK